LQLQQILADYVEHKILHVQNVFTGRIVDGQWRRTDENRGMAKLKT